MNSFEEGMGARDRKRGLEFLLHDVQTDRNTCRVQTGCRLAVTPPTSPHHHPPRKDLTRKDVKRRRRGWGPTGPPSRKRGQERTPGAARRPRPVRGQGREQPRRDLDTERIHQRSTPKRGRGAAERLVGEGAPQQPRAPSDTRTARRSAEPVRPALFWRLRAARPAAQADPAASAQGSAAPCAARGVRSAVSPFRGSHTSTSAGGRGAVPGGRGVEANSARSASRATATTTAHDTLKRRRPRRPLSPPAPPASGSLGRS